MSHYNIMSHSWCATHVPLHFTCTRMIPCSSRVKCYGQDVPCVSHGILHMKVHVHTLREMWSMQTRGVNLEYLCPVSLRVHACKSELINEQYCIYPSPVYQVLNVNWSAFLKGILPTLQSYGWNSGTHGGCQLDSVDLYLLSLAVWPTSVLLVTVWASWLLMEYP